MALAYEELFVDVHKAELERELLIAGAGIRAQLLVGVREDAPARGDVSLLARCLCSHTSFCRMDARLRRAWHQEGGTYIVCMGHFVADPCLQRLVL